MNRHCKYRFWYGAGLKPAPTDSIEQEGLITMEKRGDHSVC